MGRKKNPNNYYFTQETEDAIVAYVASTDERERNQLFSKHIYQPFCKIAEVVLNKYKIEHLEQSPEDSMADAVIFMVEQLPKFKQGAGKAFSYFTIVCRNYYIIQSNKNYKISKKVLKIGDLPEKWDIPNDDKRVQEMEDMSLLLDKFLDYLEENFEGIFNRKSESDFGRILINHLRDRDTIEDFNRRNMLNDLCELSTIRRAQITKLLNKIQIHYDRFKRNFLLEKETTFYKKENLSNFQVEYIKTNYKVNCKTNGIVALSKRFGVHEDVVRRALYS